MTRLIIPPATLLTPLILTSHIETRTLLLLSVILCLERDSVDIVRRDNRTIITSNGRLSTEYSTATLIYLLNDKVSCRWHLILLLLLTKLLLTCSYGGGRLLLEGKQLVSHVITIV